MSNDPFRRPGTAIRTGELADVVPSQDCSRYQAVNPPVFIPVRRRGFAYLWPFAAVVAYVVAGALWPIVPAWLQVACIFATPILAFAALWPVWRGRS